MAPQHTGVAQFRAGHISGESTAGTVAQLLDRTAAVVRGIADEHGDVTICAISFEQDEHASSAECTLTVFFRELN